MLYDAKVSMWDRKADFTSETGGGIGSLYKKIDEKMSRIL